MLTYRDIFCVCMSAFYQVDRWREDHFLENEGCCLDLNMVIYII